MVIKRIERDERLKGVEWIGDHSDAADDKERRWWAMWGSMTSRGR